MLALDSQHTSDNTTVAARVSMFLSHCSHDVAELEVGIPSSRTARNDGKQSALVSKPSERTEPLAAHHPLNGPTGLRYHVFQTFREYDDCK